MYVIPMCPQHVMYTTHAVCMGVVFMAIKKWSDFHARITSEEADFLEMLSNKGQSKSEILHKAIKHEMKNFPEYASKVRQMHEEKVQEWRQMEEISRMEAEKEGEQNRAYIDTTRHDFVMFNRGKCSTKHNLEWLQSRYGDRFREMGLSTSDILEYCQDNNGNGGSL